MIPRLRQAAQGCLIPKQWSDRRLGYGLNGVVVYRNLNPMTNLHQPATPRGHASRLGTQRRVYDRLYLLWTIRGFTTAPVPLPTSQLLSRFQLQAKLPFHGTENRGAGHITGPPVSKVEIECSWNAGRIHDGTICLA